MSSLSRRKFVKGLTLTGAASTVGFPSIIRAQGLNEKLQVGFVAIGGRAHAHTEACHKEGLQCIAFAEVDTER
ncbi:MAG: twin-arginine translocation signal domain-containing protein, partial [Akkermansiaceae bacterium]|nr:twin-arginine translocation signal domain-containing protein [Akkermansiaceae bacterium]